MCCQPRFCPPPPRTPFPSPSAPAGEASRAGFGALKTHGAPTGATLDTSKSHWRVGLGKRVFAASTCSLPRPSAPAWHATTHRPPSAAPSLPPPPQPQPPPATRPGPSQLRPRSLRPRSLPCARVGPRAAAPRKVSSGSARCGTAARRGRRAKKAKAARVTPPRSRALLMAYGGSFASLSSFRAAHCPTPRRARMRSTQNKMTCRGFPLYHSY